MICEADLRIRIRLQVFFFFLAEANHDSIVDFTIVVEFVLTISFSHSIIKFDRLAILYRHIRH